MKSIVRWRGVKSPTVGCACESMRPGITVVPFASMTVSASRAANARTDRLDPAVDDRDESPSISGVPMSPETIWPIPVISVRIGGRA